MTRHHTGEADGATTGAMGVVSVPHPPAPLDWGRHGLSRRSAIHRARSLVGQPVPRLLWSRDTGRHAREQASGTGARFSRLEGTYAKSPRLI